MHPTTAKKRIELMNFCLQVTQAVRIQDAVIQINQLKILANGLTEDYKAVKLTSFQ